MALSTYRRQLADAEASLASGSARLHEVLAAVPLDVVGLLLLSDCRDLPTLTAALPRLPSADVQRSWTGADGHVLMSRSCAFVKSLSNHYERLTQRSIRDAVVLDYGCGWGRLTRLLLARVPGPNIWALDPWPQSIRQCTDGRLPVNVRQSDEMPDSLPVGDTTFDLAFAFSVFTHLSERCASTVLKTMRRYIKPDGLLALTIRVPEYWEGHVPYPPGLDKHALIAEHESRGFAFIPHNRAPIEGDITYGDTSVSLEYIATRWTDWAIVATDFNLCDPYQVIVFLKPRR